MATNGTYVAYYRVSTDRQGRSGQALAVYPAAAPIRSLEREE